MRDEEEEVAAEEGAGAAGAAGGEQAQEAALWRLERERGLEQRKTFKTVKQHHHQFLSHRPGLRRPRVPLVEAELAYDDVELGADRPRPRVPSRSALLRRLLLLPNLLLLLVLSFNSSCRFLPLLPLFFFPLLLLLLHLHKGVRPPHRPGGRPELREARVGERLPGAQDGRLADDAGPADPLGPLRVAVRAVAAVDDLPGAAEELEGLVAGLVADSDPVLRLLFFCFVLGKLGLSFHPTLVLSFFPSIVFVISNFQNSFETLIKEPTCKQT